MKEKKSSRKKTTLLVCVIIVAVLILEAVALAFNPPYFKKPLESGIHVEENKWFSITGNWNPGPPITVSMDHPNFPSEQITFECSADPGELWTKNYAENAKERIFPNQTKFWWNLSNEEAAYFLDPVMDVAYVRIIIHCEDHIIGYAVVRLDRLYGRDWNPLRSEGLPPKDDDEPTSCYFSTLVEAVYFPKVLGMYQPVSRRYVEKCMQDIMDNQ